MYAIEVDNEPDMWKISLFLTVAGPEAQEVCGTFTYGTDESPKTYADVMANILFICNITSVELILDNFAISE